MKNKNKAFAITISVQLKDCDGCYHDREKTYFGHGNPYAKLKRLIGKFENTEIDTDEHAVSPTYARISLYGLADKLMKEQASQERMFGTLPA